MSYKLEQSIVPPPGTDTTEACDFEISESSSKLPAFFPRKTKCTPAKFQWMFSILNRALSWAITSFENKFCLKKRSRLIKA